MISCQCLSNFGWNGLHLSIVVFGGILSFIPFFTSEPISNIESAPIREAVRGLNFYGTCVVTLTLLVPLAVEIIFDTLARFRSAQEWIAKHSEQGNVANLNLKIAGSFNVAEKVIFMFAAACFACLPFLPRYTINIGLAAVCCRRYENCLIAGIVVASLSRYSPKYWGEMTVSLQLLLFIVGNAIGAARANTEYSTGFSPLDYVSLVMQYAACAIFVAQCLWWFLSIFLHGCKFVVDRPTPQLLHMEEENRRLILRGHLLFPTVHVTATIILLFANVAVTGIYGRFSRLNESGMVAIESIYIVFEIFLIVFDIWVEKFEKIQALVSIVNLYTRHSRSHAFEPIFTSTISISSYHFVQHIGVNGRR
jgi:hypothetical protein